MPLGPHNHGSHNFESTKSDPSMLFIGFCFLLLGALALYKMADNNPAAPSKIESSIPSTTPRPSGSR